MALNGGGVALGSDVDRNVLLVCVLWMNVCRSCTVQYQVDVYMVFRSVFCTVSIVKLMETLSK
jgi:hypothetical protein